MEGMELEAGSYGKSNHALLVVTGTKRGERDTFLLIPLTVFLFESSKIVLVDVHEDCASS